MPPGAQTTRNLAAEQRLPKWGRTGGQDRYQSEHSPPSQGSDLAQISRLVTVSPVIWDVQAIEIRTVRDGKRKLTPLAEIDVPAGLPVWLAHGAARSQVLPLPL